MKILKYFVFIYVFIIKITYIFNSTYEEVLTAFKEVAYSYYMRGRNIQYNDPRRGYFPPEEATQQKRNYLVCNFLINNIYNELLNIFPPHGEFLLYYAKKYIGNPEVIAYSEINKNNYRDFFIYSPNEKNNYKNITNYSIKDLISLVKPGDIMSYSGHTQTIYDIERDKNGNVIDAIIMDSTRGVVPSYVTTKITRNTITWSGGEIPSYSYSNLYLTSYLNSRFEEGLLEGSISIGKFSTNVPWFKINQTKLNFSIIRLINKDSNGRAILKYETAPKPFLNNDIIKLSAKNIDRIRFKHLYIEKIVNKYNNNIVVLGDILNYIIILKNRGKEDYNFDLIISENISEFVTYETHYENKSINSFNYDINNRKLTWNIGKLKKKEEIVINYMVKVTKGKPGDIIESTGLVGNIPSSVIKNVIGINLNKNQMENIKKSYEKLKSKYHGKILINEIYKNALNFDLKFDNFKIKELINNKDLTSVMYNSLELNKNNTFYGAILNKYWNSLTIRKFIFENKNEEKTYSLKSFGDYLYKNRMQDFIYKEHFITGDILLYTNDNDYVYELDKNTNRPIKKYITYEDGEYAYIYIENKGFVGINIGNDGLKNTKDDRNEFNTKYYKDNNLSIFEVLKNPSDEILEEGHMQTLFGKNYYIILRPSLCFDFSENNKASIIICVIIFSIFIFVCGILLIWKYIKRKRKESNLENINKELLYN